MLQVSRRIARYVAAATFMLSVFNAHSQTAPPAGQAASSGAPEIAEVIVTGSRISAPNEVSTSPIQVVSAKEIQQGGKTDIIDLLNQLPQNFQNAASDLSNTSTGLSSAGGVSNADLRGLGPQRTLVLVNGRRLGLGDPNTINPNPAPDLDQIPVPLIERVDVVTGGASSTYGSDAIGGVVNFVMKKNFEGIQLDGQVGEYWHSNHQGWTQNLQAAAHDEVVSGSDHDGRNRSFSVVMGSSIADGRGNVTGYMTYLHSDPVVSAQRDFGGCQLSLVPAKNGVACAGSTSSNLFSTATDTYTVVGNQFLPWPQLGSDPPASFNSQRFIFMSREDDRYSAGFFAHVDINSHVKPYAEFSFMQDKSTEVVAASGLFQSNPTDPTGNGNFNVNCNNPLLSAQEQAAICSGAQIAYAAANPSQECQFPTGAASPNCANINIGRRAVEGGGRMAYWNHTNYRAVGGISGEFLDAWNYDAYGSFYYTTLFNSNSNFLNLDKVNNALQVTTDAGGNPVCIAGGSCVPWNIFKQGGVTQAQLQALYSTGTSNGEVTERIVHADITGDLGKYGIKSPLAQTGLGVNIGAEHRSDRLVFAPDDTELSGLLSGFGGAAVSIDNGTAVKEGFAELRAPILEDQPFAKDLVFDAGFRHSDYNTSGGVNTWKFEVQYAPIRDLRFRGGYQKAIRAASVLELYTPQAFGLIGSPSVDPCAPSLDPTTNALVPATRSFADCARTGVTAAQYGNGGVGGTYTGTIKQCVALQCGQLAGGNPNLKPEQSESLTVGLNFSPSYVPNLTGSIDFYRIVVKDEVGVVAAPVILQNCLNSGDPTYCGLIVRTPTGSISGSSIATGGYIVQTNINVGAVEVKGIDVQLAYKYELPAGFGSVHALLVGSSALASTTTPYPGAHTYDCVGLYGPTCLTVNPRWRHNLRFTWNTPWNLEFSALWRYIGPVTLDGNTGDPTLSTGTFDFFDQRMPGMSYIDLSTSWQVFDNLGVRLGVNNVLDKDPPIVASNVAASGAANSLPTYDQLGRQLYVAFTAKF